MSSVVKAHAHSTRGMSLSEKLDFYSMPEPNTGCLLWLGAAKGGMGYGCVWWNDTHYTAHRLSWENKHGPIPPGTMALHKCDNPACINPDHLFLGTHQDNCDDKYNKGRQASVTGELNPRSKLTEADVTSIKQSDASGGSLSRQYGVSTTVVAHIRNGKLWGHIGGEAVRHGHAKGVRNAMAKLNPERVGQIKSSKEPIAVLAARFGVSQATISRVRNGRLWKEVQ